VGNRRGWRAKTYVEIVIYENVLILYVTVGDALTVEVVDSVDNLGEYKTRLTLRKAFVLRLLNTFKEVMGRTAEEGRLRRSRT
jgi:hypothetical protein